MCRCWPTILTDNNERSAALPEAPGGLVGRSMALNQLIERARSILLTPNITWPAIAAEPSTQGDIYKRYVLILAAIPAIFSFIDATVFGYTIPFAGTYRL